MNLFEIKNHIVTWSPEALLLEPLKVLWDRDKSKNKEVATAELAALWFYADYNSDFSSMLDEEERLRQIRVYVKSLPKDWKPDASFNAAVDFYREMSETVTTRFLVDAEIALSKLSKFLRTVDLSLEDRSGKPKYNAKQLGDTIKQVPSITKALKELKDEVRKERSGSNTLRGGRAKGSFVDE